MIHFRSKKLEVYLQDINDLLGTQELFLITTTPGGAFHLIGILDFYMQSYLSILWLKAIAVIALLLRSDKLVHNIQPPFSIFDHLSPPKLVLRIIHRDPATVKANTTQSLKGNIDKPNVINWTRQLDVTKISWIRLVVNITKTRVVHTPIDWLSGHVGLTKRYKVRKVGHEKKLDDRYDIFKVTPTSPHSFENVLF